MQETRGFIHIQVGIEAEKRLSDLASSVVTRLSAGCHVKIA
jgi:hypothetical protein